MNLPQSPPANHRTLLGCWLDNEPLADAHRAAIRRQAACHDRDRLRIERERWERRIEAERARRARSAGGLHEPREWEGKGSPRPEQ